MEGNRRKRRGKKMGRKNRRRIGRREEYSIRYNNSNKNNLTPNTSHQHET